MLALSRGPGGVVAFVMLQGVSEERQLVGFVTVHFRLVAFTLQLGQHSGEVNLAQKHSTKISREIAHSGKMTCCLRELRALRPGTRLFFSTMPKNLLRLVLVVA